MVDEQKREKIKLKKCPFYGINPMLSGDSRGLWVACFDEDCDACGPTRSSPSEAAKAWNTREGEM